MGNFWKLGFIALHCISFTLGLVKSYLKKLIPAVPWKLFWYTALVRIKFLDISQKQCIMTKISSSWVNHRPCWGSYIVNLETYLETKCGGLILSIVVFLLSALNWKFTSLPELTPFPFKFYHISHIFLFISGEYWR